MATRKNLKLSEPGNSVRPVSVASAVLAAEPALPRRPFWRVRPGPVVVGAIVILGLICLGALFAETLAPHAPNEKDLLSRFAPPFWEPKSKPGYPLGTDNLGRDVYSQILHGTRASLVVALVAPTIALLIGVPLGLLAGFVGGLLDKIIMRLVDIWLAFPFIVLAIVILGIVGPGLLSLSIVLGVGFWAAYTRIVRAEVLATRRRDYILAAEALGVPQGRIVLRHILPNVASSLIVLWTFLMAVAILAESGLSFIGLGIKSPGISLGGMLNDGRGLLEKAWWFPVFPGLVISLLVISVNVIGDWLRDVFDPTVKR